MQLTFSFSSWHIEASEGILGRQYDNLAHQIVVVGSLPEGYTWDMLVECRGNYNIIPLTVNAAGASATLTADQLALTGYYDFQLRGTQDSVIHHTNSTQVFIPDTIVGPGTWPVLPTEFSQAEAAIKELNAHPPVPGENGYWMLWDLDTHSYVQSQLAVPGLHIEIGETTTGEPGTPASVTNSGTNTAPVLDFTIPEGEKGDAATIQVGEVTASDPGSEPQVKNSGTENAAVFDFVLPRGQTGPTGPAATIEVESTVTGEPGTQASVENVGTTGAAKLKFTIPRGNTGQNGVTPTLSAGNVETLEPGQPATASVTGDGPAYQINLGIPRGQTGAQGTPGQNGQDGQTPTITVGTVTTLDPGQDATAEITGETPNLTLNLGIPEGQPGQDGVQLNDDAINTTEAWSSKKIVDTFCPSFSVSGNPVTCNPVEDYPLGAVVTLGPKQAGTGEPSPDNVRPISGYDSVQVTQLGGNLYNADALIEIDGNSEVYGYGVPADNLVIGKTYTISVNAPIFSLKISDYISSYNSVSADNITDGKFTFVMARNSNIPNKKTQYVMVAIGSTIANLVETPEQAKSLQISICAGDNAMPYEPYQPGTTATLTFPETIYGGTVDAVTGKGSKTWDFITSYNGEALPGEWISDRDVYAPGTTPTTGAQVAYKLATPEPFQATGNQALPAVSGLNTLYTDGDSLAVSGRSDPLSTIQTMQAQITALQDQATQGGTS